MSRAAVLSALSLLAVTSCSAGGMGPGGNSAGSAVLGSSGRTDLATQLACRQRVNEVYDRRNRPDIYAANSSMNSPFSANFQAGVSSRGLADQFSYGQTLSNCERTVGTGSERSEPPPAASPAPSARGR